MSNIFFFQAEDGIRDLTVTGVQTCALPISPMSCRAIRMASRSAAATARAGVRQPARPIRRGWRSEEHTSELQSQSNLVCRLLLEKKKIIRYILSSSNYCSNYTYVQYAKL